MLGVVQIIGHDGRALKNKIMSSPQKGEKIDNNLIKDIVYESISAYKDFYNEQPKHITFHRDGLNREDVDILETITQNTDIKFNYVEITKNINRRMAFFDALDKKYKTDRGSVYVKDKTAFITTTEPSENLGMAQPIRVKSVYGEMDIYSIVEDVYALTFMHIGSILKNRLPITTHYADLNSTYSNRGLIAQNVEIKGLHFL